MDQCSRLPAGTTSHQRSADPPPSRGTILTKASARGLGALPSAHRLVAAPPSLAQRQSRTPPIRMLWLARGCQKTSRPSSGPRQPPGTTARCSRPACAGWTSARRASATSQGLGGPVPSSRPGRSGALPRPARWVLVRVATQGRATGEVAMEGRAPVAVVLRWRSVMARQAGTVSSSSAAGPPAPDGPPAPAASPPDPGRARDAPPPQDAARRPP